jgi:curli biogenesis system outer membrane secretion channel CsgG
MAGANRVALEWASARSVALGLLLTLTGCATPAPVPRAVEAPAAVAPAQAQMLSSAPAVKTLKRKIAIGRFTNESRYGRALTLLSASELDPLGKQTSDMLSARLVESGKFTVLERQDLTAVKNEQALAGTKENLIGADTLIVGSLTEFGRSTEGKAGFLSNTKKQTARAKVEVRLINVTTGVAYFSAAGAGEAAVESGTVMGFGDQAAYDSTLNERAIGAAVSDLLNSLVTKLTEQPWHSDILKAEGNAVMISGGSRQGLNVGDRLLVMKSSETVRSSQTGVNIQLPPTRVAEIQIESFFGTDDLTEGSVARVVSGAISPGDTARLFVAEAK